jgi:hypothetical protein
MTREGWRRRVHHSSLSNRSISMATAMLRSDSSSPTAVHKGFPSVVMFATNKGWSSSRAWTSTNSDVTWRVVGMPSMAPVLY